MVTKKEYCIGIIEKYIVSNLEGDHPKSYSELIPHIYSSTMLGIALEFLGYITKENNPEEFEYLSNRGGIVEALYLGDNSNHLINTGDYYNSKNSERLHVIILSMRDILEILPETIDGVEVRSF